ncbi:MAG: hypothetical protein ACKN9T_14950 [Candidatus Methylumidiphilus sp.]
MEQLFSCRNCIHNCGQSLLIGNGAGFCLKHHSVLYASATTTCKYLHRKDLPSFVVDEGIREHAAEFAEFSNLADLLTHQPIDRIPYSERFVWERRQYDPINQSLAHYHKTKPVWVFLEAMSGGVDGRRMLTHASLVRRYMANCGMWRSTYRFVLSLIHEFPNDPQFSDAELVCGVDDDLDLVRDDARWDVFFVRLGCLQEYGFHSGLPELMWATDHLDGGLSSLDWNAMQNELAVKVPQWSELIVEHARSEDAFFPQAEPDAWETGEAL